MERIEREREGGAMRKKNALYRPRDSIQVSMVNLLRTIDCKD